MLNKYYDDYWKKRIEENVLPPIRSSIPKFLQKYSFYGAILNQIPTRSKILDVGCGDGNVASLYLQKGEVYGVDISKNALKRAEKKGIKTKLCDLNENKLPFGDNNFDAVIFTDVVEHLINPLSALKEAKRVLRVGGLAIIVVPNFARLSNRIKMLMGDPIDILHWEKYGDEVEHLHWLTAPKIKHLLTQAGFSKIRFVPIGLPFNFLFGVIKFPQLGKYLTVVAEE